jgi:hypothetical protein
LSYQLLVAELEPLALALADATPAGLLELTLKGTGAGRLLPHLQHIHIYIIYIYRQEKSETHAHTTTM